MTEILDGRIQYGRIQYGRIQDGRIQDGRIQDGQIQDGLIQDGRIQDGWIFWNSHISANSSPICLKFKLKFRLGLLWASASNPS